MHHHIRRHSRHHRWPARFIQWRIRRKLKLSLQQEEKLSALHDSMREIHEDMHQLKAASRRDVAELLHGETLDREQALQLLQGPRQALEHGLPTVVERFAELYDSLSATQRERLQHWWSRRLPRQA